MNNTFDKARELGNSIIQSLEFQNLLRAEDDFHNDVELLAQIEEHNSMKGNYDSKNPKFNNEDEYLKHIKKLEQSIAENTTVNTLNTAKGEYDKLFKSINNLISYITNEESRVTLPLLKEKKGCGCSGGCGGCSTK